MMTSVRVQVYTRPWCLLLLPALFFDIDRAPGVNARGQLEVALFGHPLEYVGSLECIVRRDDVDSQQ